jgi:hypothetical protein
VSNRNTAKIEKDKRAELAQRHDAGQAGALDRPAPSNHNHRTPPRDRPRPALEPDPRDEQDDSSRPPLPGKLHPPMEKNDATPTLDDEVRNYRHHPNEAGTTEFAFDPEAADAAADLAGELGSQFLEGATRGEDLSSRVPSEEDQEENELPFLIEDGFEPVDIDLGASEMLLEPGEEEEGEPPDEERGEDRSSKKRQRAR